MDTEIKKFVKIVNKGLISSYLKKFIATALDIKSGIIDINIKYKVNIMPSVKDISNNLCKDIVKKTNDRTVNKKL